MIRSPEMNDQIDKWRVRASLPTDHPEAMTLPELREAMRLLREDRKSAVQSTAKKKASKEPVDVNKILEGW